MCGADKSCDFRDRSLLTGGGGGIKLRHVDNCPLGVRGTNFSVLKGSSLN